MNMLQTARPHLGSRSLPDFLIIGAQKSATTSLLAYMGRHPDVKLGHKKATHYFDLNHAKGLGWYARNFPPTRPFPFGLLSSADGVRSWLTGESCPSYMFLPEVPARVQADLPQAKLIVILRNPVKRLVSQYYHEKRKGRAAGTFAEFIALSRNMTWPPAGDIEDVRQNAAIPRGYYAEQLGHWHKFFPAEQFLVLCFEELVKDSAPVMDAAFRFLGLSEYHVDTSEVLNKGSGEAKERIDAGLLSELDALYRERNAGLEMIAGRKFPW